MWAGAFALLALVGCSDKKGSIKDTGVYSPILTGIASNHEPAARGAANQLTAQVTNVNGMALTYHWMVQAGTLADSTSASVTWTPPDTIGTFDVTASIEARDGDKYFFRTMTVHMSVDNEFTRYTKSVDIKFDPAPMPGGGALYAQYRNVSAGTSDAWRIDAPMGLPIQMTDGFYSVSSPTPRADKTMFAFTGKATSDVQGNSLFTLPFGGGDSTLAVRLSAPNVFQSILLSPRFARAGTWLLYETDSTSSPFTHLWKRDLATFTSAPVPVFDPADTLSFIVFPRRFADGNWGPDSTSDGIPDYVVSTWTSDFGVPAGVITVPADNAHAVSIVPFLSDPTMEEPDWSPDGKDIVFSKRNPAGDRDLWIINIQATSIDQAVRVTYGPADDWHPRFNEDGSQIYFVSNRVDRYGTTGIYGTERRGTDIWSVAHFDRP